MTDKQCISCGEYKDERKFSIHHGHNRRNQCRACRENKVKAAYPMETAVRKPKPLPAWVYPVTPGVLAWRP